MRAHNQTWGAGLARKDDFTGKMPKLGGLLEYPSVLGWGTVPLMHAVDRGRFTTQHPTMHRMAQ